MPVLSAVGLELDKKFTKCGVRIPDVFSLCPGGKKRTIMEPGTDGYI
jgi:hypothetical protein